MKTSSVILVVLAALGGGLVLAKFATRTLHPGGPPVQRLALRTQEGGSRVMLAAGEQAPAGEAKHASRKPHSRGEGPQVHHQPQQPKSGEAVVITAEFQEKTPPAAGLLVEYQVVEPGKYIGLRDEAYKKEWTAIPMSPATRASQKAVFQAQLPGDIQKNRRLVRYRIRAATDHSLLAPAKDDAQPNYAYFVYDGLPDWKGAINPSSRDETLRKEVTYSPEALGRVAVYQFISSRRAVERVTWKESDQFGGSSRNAYKYTGTMVYDGVVYDHIGFRARGGIWRHAMGKNMWKFNFLPGHHLAARDAYGRPYNTKWDKLNLGACIQQGDYGMRGEQGMFEAVGFRLFNLAGIEAPKTHWVHLRVIDQAEENPRDQYAGDFWGLYLAVENVDEYFLREHNLPPGNLYKMDFNPKTEFNGDPSVTDQSDITAFLGGLMRQRPPNAWWLANVDLPRYYDYRSIIECIHHYDVDSGKNYFFYDNPQSHHWIVFPWDIDLTWGDHMYGGGGEPYYRSGILFKAPFKQQYQQRLAEIRDLLFNPEQTDQLIEEYAAMISDPACSSIVGADRAKWDFNPIMNSPYVQPMKASQGRFYFGNPHNTFRSMVDYMKNYVAERGQWIDARLLADYHPPTAPEVRQPGGLDLKQPALNFQLAGTAGSKSYRWRLAEINDSHTPAPSPNQPQKYEIQPLWEQEAKGDENSVALPSSLLSPGHSYRLRARAQDQSGAWSRWSKPVQFRVPQ